MNTTQMPPLRKRPGVIATLAVLLAVQGISALSIGIWMIFTRRILFPSQPLPISAINYLLRLIPSSPAQMVLSILVGILFFVLVWGLIMLKPWAYWVTLIVFLPSWMIYDLSKMLLLFFHALPPNLFESPDISANAVSFIVVIVLFILILRRNVRNSFYLSGLNMNRIERSRMIVMDQKDYTKEQDQLKS